MEFTLSSNPGAPNTKIPNNQVPRYLWWLDPGQMPGAQKNGLSLSSSAGHKRENTTKDLWIETRTGKDHSPNAIGAK